MGLKIIILLTFYHDNTEKRFTNEKFGIFIGLPLMFQPACGLPAVHCRKVSFFQCMRPKLLK